MNVYVVKVQGDVVSICEDRADAYKLLVKFINANIFGYGRTTALAFLKTSYERGGYKFGANKNYNAECFPLLTYKDIG